MLTSSLSGSTVEGFDLYSFWYACSINLDNPTGDHPQACRITATAYKGEGNTADSVQEVGAQTFVYNPTTNTGLQQMAFTGTLSPWFNGVQFVTFTYQILGNALLNED